MVQCQHAACAVDVLLLWSIEYIRLWCAQPRADHFAQVVIHLLSPICSSSQLFILTANTWVYLSIPEYLCFPSAPPAPFYFSYSEENPCKYLQRSALKQICISKYTYKIFDKDSCLVTLPKHVLFLPCPLLPVWEHLLSCLLDCKHSGRLWQNLFLLFAHHYQVS